MLENGYFFSKFDSVLYRKKPNKSRPLFDLLNASAEEGVMFTGYNLLKIFALTSCVGNDPELKPTPQVTTLLSIGSMIRGFIVDGTDSLLTISGGDTPNKR